VLFVGWLAVRAAAVLLLVTAGTEPVNPLHYMYLVPLYWLASILLTIRTARARDEEGYRLSCRPRVHYLLLVLTGLAISVSGDLLMRKTMVGAYFTASESMEPTLMKGDFILADKLRYRDSVPRRNDLIVFDAPFEKGEAYTKRVLGLPGDTVEIRDRELLIDGRRHYCNKVQFRRPGGSGRIPGYGPEVVPEDCVFVIGDNLANSFDSRHWGPLGLDKVIGSLRIIYFSIDLESKKVRWDRIGKIVR
jgi:signal peptidase I